MRRLLVVAYYMPPLGLSGVMRVTKLCKFLPEAGWQPLILTVKPVAYYHYDLRLLEDLRTSRIYRTESADPNRLFNLVRSKSKRLTPALARGLGAGPRLLNHLLFPDSKIGWLPFGSVAGRHIIDREKPAAIFASAPPFTALLLGVRLKAHAHVPLAADFRDPWPTGFAPPPRHQRAALRRLRRYLVDRSDLVLGVNAGTARSVGPRCEVLDNGYDPTDFEVEPARLEGFSIVHVGNLWQNQAEVASFMAALRQRPEARLYLAGRVDGETRRRFEHDSQVRLLSTVPHNEACALMKGAAALLYIGKPAQPVGIKLYEYLGAKRPILVWGEGSDEAAALVKEAGAGVACGLDAGRLVEALDEMKRDPAQFARTSRDQFNRRSQARRLADRLESLI
ncbi:glycosyltransferase family 4 protein [candidate division WOR-3 bacterium]|uniref:Glycosyltransferase family 4 protein n=1 Tax=candidate division WOR-3 bacterium TaxID=2052148 RepID=A0A937XIJ5_UNCW3|nr:glycosyltransferase family 4 protein [candidate division WOR-3 bacterium]